MSSTDLLSRIEKTLPKVAEALKTEFREELNRNIHILDLSYNSLKVNVYLRRNLVGKELTTYNSVHNTLYEVVKTACINRTFNSLDDPGFLPLFNKKPSVGPILIDGGNNHLFLVGISFDAIQKFASKFIARNPKLKVSRFGAYTKFTAKKDAKGRILPDEYTEQSRTKFDIGHIPSEDNPNLVSPFEKKLETIVSAATAAGNTRVQVLAQRSLKELYKIQADLSYSFKNTTPENINTARKVLGEAYVVVTLHSEKLNHKFSVQENRIYHKLVAEIATSTKLHNIRGSNTIVLDIATHLARTISGNKTPLTKHKSQKASKKTTISNNSSSTPVKLVLGGKEKPREEGKVNTNQTISNLTSLLASRLHDQIKKNMGSGQSKNVLNYQTGRFAQSATIERLTASREGVISVFYNYMRNPYGTFSDGGQQQHPKTRDPKTLISRSIREIGAQAAFTRMRAVLV